MLPIERKRKITNILSKEGTVSIPELSKQLDVSEMTIRRDLNDLYDEDKIIKVSGGAMIKSQSVLTRTAFDHRKDKEAEEKRRIGKLAASFINDNDTILMDTGTTILEIIKNLKDKETFILTNSLQIAIEASKYKKSDVFMPGGFLKDSDQLNLIGNTIIDSLEKFSIDKLFLGAYSINDKFELSYLDVDETYIREKMIDIAKEVYLVITSSKFNKDGRISIDVLSKIDYIITDENITKENIEFCINNGTNLYVVEEDTYKLYKRK